MKHCGWKARGMVGRMLMVALTAGLFMNARPVQATSLFINEIHYDNAGTDIGEGVEVAGIAGTALGDWSLWFYNGNDGKAYDSLALNGILPDRMNGFGTLAFGFGGLQNGPADGIALVHGAEVVQFLSCEGSLGAADGPAAGLVAVDIGIAETSATVVGDSLQLTGSGRRYEDFTWVATANTFGGVNSGQTFLASSPLPTPEPETFLLLGLGIAGMVVLKKRPGGKK